MSRVYREVIASTLPTNLQGLIGKTVELFDAHGNPCTATIERFYESRFANGSLDEGESLEAILIRD